MFMNLLAEMARNNYTRDFIAKELGITLPSFRKKLSGVVEFKRSEIDKIISIFGNNLSYEYLFQES